MSTSLNQNQFGQLPIRGQSDLIQGGYTVSCVVKSDEATALIPGQAVKIYDSGTGLPIVTAVTADTDDVFGFVAYNVKNQSFAANVPVEIAFFGKVMWMLSSGAIAWMDRLMVVVSGTKVAKATANAKKTCIGIALGHVADATLVRVLIQTPSPLVAASFTQLGDAPATLVGNDFIKVNGGGTALVNSVS